MLRTPETLVYACFGWVPIVLDLRINDRTSEILIESISARMGILDFQYLYEDNSFWNGCV